MVLGGHGDTMVPLVSYTTVSGIPVTQLHRARTSSTRSCTGPGTAARKSSALLKTGSAYYAPERRRRCRWSRPSRSTRSGSCPVPAWLQGEYGLKDVFCGVPCKLGRNGLERIARGRADGRGAEGPARVRRGGAGRRMRGARRGTRRSWLAAFYRSTLGRKVVMARHGPDAGAASWWPTWPETCWCSRAREAINAYVRVPQGQRGGALDRSGVVLLVAVRAARRAAAVSSPAEPRGAAGGVRPAEAPGRRRSPPRLMRWGGFLLLAFIVFHLLHFTIGTMHPEFDRSDDVYAQRDQRLPGARWSWCFYLVAMVALGLAPAPRRLELFQTLGWNHPPLNPHRPPARDRSLGFAWSAGGVLGDRAASRDRRDPPCSDRHA